MIWEDLSIPWQYAVEEAWIAYCHGSLPHGAVVTDADDRVLSRGRNRIYEKAAQGTMLHGHPLAHAEMNALTQVDWSTVNERTCILYSTIEPCAMCTGAVRMARLREVRYAARDNFSGGSSLIDKTAFLKSGNMNITGSENYELEVVLLSILIEVALTIPHPDPAAWVEKLSSGLPIASQLGHELFASKQLRSWREEGRGAAFVVNELEIECVRLNNH